MGDASPRKRPAHLASRWGTLQRHETSTSSRRTEVDGIGKVWQEIKRPSQSQLHSLSLFLGYSYVKLSQKHFGYHSSHTVLKSILLAKITKTQPTCILRN
ncbi:unnamed protein product [Eruca vesicaria subsp. sativa]|uniref:Uncharacterized protein n=1 Tax=Eruca vesicaria subsp. sativa TaxID=29727 RepID=A0ABC8LZ65_ERUVS|nr:unnamed protein product [Eruca vesicaria subsp. sativa]